MEYTDHMNAPEETQSLQSDLYPDIYFGERGADMEQEPLVIHCTYDENGPELRDLVMSSFRAFIQAELRIFAEPDPDGVS